MNNLILSVIIPVYNVQEFLDDCIHSFISQLSPFVELILVDDGSPDKCPQICDKWANSYRNIKVIHKKNGGLSDARNTGILAANGTYIWFVDSDDWISSTAIFDILSLIDKFGDADMVATQLVEVKDGKKQIYGVYPAFPNQPIIVTNKEYVRGGYPVLPSVRYIVKRKLLIDDDLMFIKGVLHEDIPFCHMLIYKAKKIILLKKPTYYYRIRSGSITTAPKIESPYSLVKTHKIIKQFYESQVDEFDRKWFLNLTYDYFHEMFLRLYPFINTDKYSVFMKENKTYITDEFNKLWKYVSFKRRLLILCFNISPILFSYLLYSKKK